MKKKQTKKLKDFSELGEALASTTTFKEPKHPLNFLYNELVTEMDDHIETVKNEIKWTPVSDSAYDGNKTKRRNYDY